MTNSFQNQMDKRGQVLEVLGILFILGITIYGASKVYYDKESIYVSYNMTVYKYSECKVFINSLSKEDIVVFTSYDQIDWDKYQKGECK